jgi:hypothetical protein
MTGYTRHTPIYLIDATDTPVGVVDRLGREWLFPASLTAGADGGSIGNLAFGQLLHDSTDTPIGYQVFGREFIFASPFTPNTTRGLRQAKRPLLLSAAGVPQGLFVRSGVASQFAALPAEGGTVSGIPFASDLVGHFAADAITPQTDNTALTSWTDSVTGLALTQATGAAQPKYRTNVIGGLPGVQCSGAQWLSGSIPALKTAMDTRTGTVYIVVSNTAAKPNGTVFGNSTGGQAFAFMHTGALIGRFANGTQLQLPYTSGANLVCFGSTSSATKYYPTQSGTALERVYVNGMCKYSNTTAWPATNAADGQFTIGAINSSGALPFSGYVHEVFCYNRVLTQNEMLQLEIYVRNKYSTAPTWNAVSSIPCMDGDSITDGVGATNLPAAYPYLTAQALGLIPGQWSVQAVGGMTTAGITAKIPDWNQIGTLTGKVPKVAFFEWYNNHVTAISAAQSYTNIQAYASTLKANITTARLAGGTSTAYSGDPDPTDRDAYNSLLDGNHSFFDAYIQLHANATIGVSGAYASGSATYWSDTVHFKDAGYAVLAPLMTAGINAL